MKKKMKWTVVEEIAVSSIFPWPYAWRGWVNGIAKYLGKAFSEGITLSENGSILHCYHEKESLELGKVAIQKSLDPKWVELVVKDTYAAMQSAASFAQEKIIKPDLSKKTNAELLEIYNEANQHIEALYSVGLVPSTMDMGHNMFSQMLSDYVEKRKMEVGLASEQTGEIFAALTTVPEKTLQQKQEEGFLKLLADVEKNNEWKKALEEGKCTENKPLHQRIKAHAEKYGWLSRGYEGPITWTQDYFTELLKSELKQNVTAEQKLSELEATRSKLLQKQKPYEEKLSMDEKYSAWFKVARRFTVIKNERKDVVLKLYYDLDKLMKEIAKRLNITYKQSMYITPVEMPSTLLEGKVDESTLTQRKKLCYLLVNAKEITMHGSKEAAEFLKQIEGEKKEVNELQGHCACPGKATGIIRIINTQTDMAKMKQGDILVSHATEPNLVPAMKKAAAIITDQGGITSHAAIVSRELGIPCVIGTKIATKAFRDGDKVSVDATNGIIKKID
ncbi:MAG: PEP-utilizing enzyme [Candidatus Micrarchaeota archaeon]|nr:PEP-utilizing enzyme [Candidatus Micrarchaeota archaeon]